MRHRMAGRKLGRTTSHRWAMLRNMATSLFRHERITTTVAKAKELRPFAEKLITLAKKETLHARRQVLRHIKDREVVSKLFDTLGPRFATRPGGYSRIVRTSPRRGDSSELAIIELIDSSAPVAAKKKAAGGKKGRKGAAPSRKPVHRGTARQEALADVAAVEEARAEAEEEEAAGPAEAKAEGGEAEAPADETEKAEEPETDEKKKE
jgi:large subunit ribosomal protein L17